MEKRGVFLLVYSERKYILLAKDVLLVLLDIIDISSYIYNMFTYAYTKAQNHDYVSVRQWFPEFYKKGKILP